MLSFRGTEEYRSPPELFMKEGILLSNGWVVGAPRKFQQVITTRASHQEENGKIDAEIIEPNRNSACGPLLMLLSPS